MSRDWRAAYEQVAVTVLDGAPAARPLLAGFNTCVDHVYRLEPPGLDRLTPAAQAAHEPLAALSGEPLAALSGEVLRRILDGRDGEVFVPAPQLRPALDELLGPPAARQVGGTGAQAAWVLAVLNAPSVLALADRSTEQLAVLHPGIGLCDDGSVRPVAGTAARGTPIKPPHYILEYAAGTRWHAGTVRRSSRIIVRLAEDGIERDDTFAALGPTLAETAGAGLVSGLNGVPDADHAARAWLRDLAASWRASGLPWVHLELAEYPRPGALAEVSAAYAGIAHTLGLSLAELAIIRPGGDPAAAARELAEHYRFDRVFVHADTWSLVVHRGDPEPAAGALRIGNLLAASRARHGGPTADLGLDPTVTFTDDRPVGRPLGDGWRTECVPTPYLSRPAATIGLGDTFVAGVLLAGCLDVPLKPFVRLSPGDIP
ncbi:ADP-dependent glucokinase/phosphofructokinase [Nonomuraea guangzhouensis]|uniref:ADP-dependent glucokinase/phosphofructokinase n=1 Tax=Nonomuraea guangzhouensis TaxID=1291555 RepID=UPI001C5D4FEB|nr:ADP-dependent glucokinase/phosphofructokinase [Nonomuraea guangzhouensis]